MKPCMAKRIKKTVWILKIRFFSSCKNALNLHAFLRTSLSTKTGESIITAFNYHSTNHNLFSEST